LAYPAHLTAETPLSMGVSAVSDVLLALLDVGSPVAVRDLYTGAWVEGFTVEEQRGSPPWGYRLRHGSEDPTFAQVVPALDVIPVNARH
jgi:hypothetical protein